MRTLIKGGHIITAENAFTADILIDGETIAAIGRDLQAEAEQTVDARGKFVFPGGVYGGENTSRPAGVRPVRQKRTERACSRAVA